MRHVNEVQASLGLEQQSGHAERLPNSEGGRQAGNSVRGVDDAWRPAQQDERDLLDNFWSHMAGMYPHRWSSQYGDVPQGSSAQVWLAVLREMPARQVKIGLRCCLYSADEWPPAPGKFRAMVLENDRPEHRPAGQSIMIAAQPAQDSVREKHMSEIREMLRMGESNATDYSGEDGRGRHEEPEGPEQAQGEVSGNASGSGS